MNNFERITLPDDVGAGELYDEVSGETAVQKAEDSGVKKKKPAFFKPEILKIFSKASFRRSAVLTGCVLLIAAAVWLNLSFSEQTGSGEQIETGTRILGDPAFVSEQQEPDDDYFTVAVINRQRVRDEAIDMLREVAQNVENDAAVRENAYSEITRMANETDSEVNIENLVMAKGFEDCLAVISGDTASVVVKSDGLSPEQVAQIQEIVCTQAGTHVGNIRIIEAE